MSESNKRRRPEDAKGDPHAQVLELLRSKLHVATRNGTDNWKPFQEEIRRIQHGKQLLQALQESLKTLQQQAAEREIGAHQHYSAFNSLLDPAVRYRVLSFLDEEGLWVLEESTMMQLEEERIRHKWKELWEGRKHNFPDMMGGDGDDDEQEDEDDSDDSQDEEEDEEARETRIFKRERWKTYGVLFAKASRMARCMEELAQQHYGTNFPLAGNPKGHKNPFQWPTSTCNTLRVDRMDNTFFVRISYQHDKAATSPLLVLEGFVELPYWTIREEVGHSEAILEFASVKEEVSDLFYKELNKVYNQEYDIADIDAFALYHQELATTKQNMGNQLSITILEMNDTIDRDNQQIKLVVSTTGFSSEDGEYIYLTPRSPNFQDRGYEVDNCIRVGFELEQDGQSLKIQLTG